MTTTYEEVPTDVRDRDASTDGALLPAEKELLVTCPNDVDYCRVTTEIPTFVKWLQSIEESSFDWVRTDEQGAIVACSATIPKGQLKLQGSARKSNQHSQMVSYGELRD